MTPTIAEMVEKVRFSGDQENTLLCKNLFLNNKKKKEEMWLVCTAHDTEVNMRALEKSLGMKNGDCRAAAKETMFALLGCEPGKVNLFSLMNDKDKKVKLIIDKRLMEATWVGYHPMDNTATVSISKADQDKVIELSSHEP